jgi:hypothetical protein
MLARPVTLALVAVTLLLTPRLAALDDTMPPPDTAAPAAAAATAAGDELPAAEPAGDDEAAAGVEPEDEAEVEAEAEPVPVPQLVLVDAVHDLGRIQRGERAAVEFTLENRGDAPLRIRSVQPACGCTVASFDPTIAPGESGRVRASLDSSTLAGAIAKSITVISNDPASPRAVLTIKAEIVSFVAVSPAFARILQVQSLPPAPTVVRLWSGDGTPVEVLGVDTPEPWIEAHARRAEPAELAPDAPAEQWRIEVQLTPDAPLGPLTDKLVVRTSHPRQRDVEIPLSGFVRAVLTPAPAVADFGNLGRHVLDKKRFVLKLFNFGAEPIEIERAATDIAFVSVVTAAEDPGRRFRVELRLAPDAPKGKFAGTLRLETTSPSMPVVEVPVRGKIG